MCDPASAIMAVSMGMQVMSGLAQAGAQSDAGDLQAQAYEQQIEARSGRAHV